MCCVLPTAQLLKEHRHRNFCGEKWKSSKKNRSYGLSNFDYVEIKDNVQPGDVIITSDMSAYKNAKEITINN